MNAGEELFRENLALIDRVIGRVSAKGRLYGADAEDFASEMHLALMADGYAILNSWEKRSSLATYLTIAIQRLFINARVRESGKWHASAEAVRMGPAAVELERLVRREGRSLDEALPFVQAIDASLIREQVAAMADRFPTRAPRAHDTGIDPDMLPGGESADARALEADTQRVADRANEVMRSAIAALPLEERMIVRYRFGRGMAVSDIARMMKVEQRPLYRRLEAILRRLRTALTEAGVDAATVSELIGSPFQPMNFGLADMENSAGRLSKEVEARR